MLHFWEVSPPLTSPQRSWATWELLLVASMIYHSLCPEPSSTGQSVLPSARRPRYLPATLAPSCLKASWPGATSHPFNPGSPRHPPTSILPISKSTGTCEPSSLCAQPPQSTLHLPQPRLLPCNTTCVAFLHCRFSILRFLGHVIFLFINLWWLSPHSEQKLKSLQCPSVARPCYTPTTVNPTTVLFPHLFAPFSQVKPGLVSGLLHLVPLHHIFDAPLPSSISALYTIIPWLPLSPPN